MSEGTVYTIRPATAEERKDWGPAPPGSRNGRQRGPRYLMVLAADPDVYCLQFFMPVGANSKAATLFWAERWIRNNGGELQLPDEFRGVRARLRR